MPLEVQLVSPEQVLFTGEADFVLLRTVGGGDIGFRPGHARFLGALASWPVHVYLSDETDEAFAVHGGFVEVSDDRVTILSDVAELSDQVDIVRAEEAKRRAVEVLHRNPDDLDAQEALQRARTRLEVAAGREAGPER